MSKEKLEVKQNAKQNAPIITFVFTSAAIFFVAVLFTLIVNAEKIGHPSGSFVAATQADVKQEQRIS